MGHERLHSLATTLARSYKNSTISFIDNGTHVLLNEDLDVPRYPLICLAKLVSFDKNNKEESVFFVLFYLLFLMLSGVVLVVNLS